MSVLTKKLNEEHINMKPPSRIILEVRVTYTIYVVYKALFPRLKSKEQACLSIYVKTLEPLQRVQRRMISIF
jgi:hypothetical protein